jgi:hypothetical protein
MTFTYDREGHLLCVDGEPEELNPEDVAYALTGMRFYQIVEAMAEKK